MNLPEPTKDYLEDLRDEVCARCAAGHAPPCDRLLPLAQLLEALGIDSTGLPCEPPCPCPPGRLAELAGPAAESLERRDRMRQRLFEAWDD